MCEGIGIKQYTHEEIGGVDEREVLRYAGVKAADAQTTALLKECIAETQDGFSYRAVYRILTAEAFWKLAGRESAALQKNLCGCERVIVFAATVGLEIDRLIAKYARLAPSKALLLQALGAERIERLCDRLCDGFQKKYAEQGLYLRPRFSAGYGDFALENQRVFFQMLDCRKIGLSLNKSLLMSPTKSVTAVAGLCRESARVGLACATCEKKDCEYKKQ